LGVGKPAEAAPSASDIAAHDQDLQRLLGRSSSPSQPTAQAAGPTALVEAMIREAVAPHVVGKPDPRQADLVAAVDEMNGELMRAVLHNPAFQNLEAIWRGLDRLIRSLDLDETLQVYVLDASREELVQDLAGAPDMAESATYRLITDPAAGDPWSLLVDLTPYRRGEPDAALLARLGAMAQEADAAVLAGLDGAAAGEGFTSPEAQQAWTTLRNSPVAPSIAVALPSILLRLPYGRDTEPVDGFAFTEQTVPPANSRYLWGSAAGAVAQLLAQSFAGAGGWDFAPGDGSSIDDLPIHVSKNEGESVQTPCAQTWLPEAKVDALIREGLMPLVSVRGRGEVRVPRFQSIAQPPAPLAGRWRSE
jgi:type VI secretion system protein ImpC